MTTLIEHLVGIPVAGSPLSLLGSQLWWGTIWSCSPKPHQLWSLSHGSAWSAPAARSPMSLGSSQPWNLSPCQCSGGPGSDVQSHNHGSCHALMAWHEVRLCVSCIRSYHTFACTSARGFSYFVFSKEMDPESTEDSYKLSHKTEVRKGASSTSTLSPIPSVLVVHFNLPSNMIPLNCTTRQLSFSLLTRITHYFWKNIAEHGFSSASLQSHTA